MSDELLPCPFCGTTPIIRHLYLAGEPTCPLCHIKTDFYVYQYGERNVIKVWNRRTHDPR